MGVSFLNNRKQSGCLLAGQYKMSITTKFKKTNGELNTLFDQIDRGELGLPELQRPFVWGNNKVRDLFDSMYQGYPVGYFLFWVNETDGEYKTKQIGENIKISQPDIQEILADPGLEGSISVEYREGNTRLGNTKNAKIIHC